MENGRTHETVSVSEVEEAQRLVVDRQWASLSLIQSQMRVGLAKAIKILDLLVDRGIVRRNEETQSWDVLISALEMPHIEPS